MSKIKYEPIRECWICGRNGNVDPLDRHHIFGGAYRSKSERLGLVVDLCHDRCHENGPDAVHRNAETMRKLREYGQRVAMEQFGWTVDDFRREFGKNYISEKPAPVADNECVMAFGFTLLKEAGLPY